MMVAVVFSSTKKVLNLGNWHRPEQQLRKVGCSTASMLSRFFDYKANSPLETMRVRDSMSLLYRLRSRLFTLLPHSMSVTPKYQRRDLQ